MYQKIMVPLDGSELAECVLPHVESIAKGCGVPDVIFVRAVEPFRMLSGGEGGGFNEDDAKRIEADNRREATDYLKDLVGRVKSGGVNVRSEIISGPAADSLADYAAKNNIDLIVISTHGRSGISRWVFGSVADRILRSACVPVLMVRAPGCVPGIKP